VLSPPKPNIQHSGYIDPFHLFFPLYPHPALETIKLYLLFYGFIAILPTPLSYLNVCKLGSVTITGDKNTVSSRVI
jgi:hypothetical protein